MFATAKAPSRLLFNFYDLLTTWPLRQLPARRTAQPHELSLEEATAHLPPHMLVDIGLASPSSTGDRTAPASQPLVPPVAAMHRRGDWGGHALGRQHADEDLPPITLTWTWPLRI